VKHPSRVRGPDQWQGPGGRLRLGRRPQRVDVRLPAGPAHRAGEQAGERLGHRPPAVDERQVADELPVGAGAQGLLLDRGFQGRAWQEAQRGGGATVLGVKRCDRRLLPPGPALPEHTAHEHQQLAHAGHQLHLPGLPCPKQAPVTLPEPGVVPHGHQGSQARCLPSPGPAAFVMRLLPERRPLSQERGATPAREAMALRPTCPSSGR